MFRLEISLKRVQSFIFDVPRLKAMLGANALIGQTIRHDLTNLLKDGFAFPWPEELTYAIQGDPLNELKDNIHHDDPKALYAKGILARDGGHFIVAFRDELSANNFLHQAEILLANQLPGVMYDAKITPIDASSMPPQNKPLSIIPQEIHLLDLPVLQVCQETGKEPASKKGEKVDWQAESVSRRYQMGDLFYEGKSLDIIGLMQQGLYPESMKWKRPTELRDLTCDGYVALIHTDGNGIGLRYNNWKVSTPSTATENVSEAYGEAFFHSMRVAVRRALIDSLQKTFTVKEGIRPYEVLMLGGDDLLLVCRADMALAFAHHYAEALQSYTLVDGSPLSVAIGVAIAKATYPFHRLHELAESLASSAKRLYRSYSSDKPRPSVIDWQVISQSWFEGVSEARQQSEKVTYSCKRESSSITETLLLTGKPYPVLGENPSLASLLDIAIKLYVSKDATRVKLRTLRSACEHGKLAGEMAFASLPRSIRDLLVWKGERHGSLWTKLPVSEQEDLAYYLTRALDIIDILELSRLGRNSISGEKND